MAGIPSPKAPSPTSPHHPSLACAPIRHLRASSPGLPPTLDDDDAASREQSVKLPLQMHMPFFCYLFLPLFLVIVVVVDITRSGGRPSTPCLGHAKPSIDVQPSSQIPQCLASFHGLLEILFEYYPLNLPTTSYSLPADFVLVGA